MLSLPAGKRMAVPARLREFPLGLSPDARLIAGTTPRLGGPPAGVIFGQVRGGPMTEIIRGVCVATATDERSCPYGADPSFAWSPDSHRLAAAVNSGQGPTILRLFTRSGLRVRSFALPRQNPERPGRAYHRLISWSPDGSHLLLMRSDPYIDTAVVALDVHTGRLRTLDRMGDPHDSPTVAWSPNGRLIALTTGQDGSWGGGYAYAVIDVADGRTIIQCTRDCTAMVAPSMGSGQPKLVHGHRDLDRPCQPCESSLDRREDKGQPDIRRHGTRASLRRLQGTRRHGRPRHAVVV